MVDHTIEQGYDLVGTGGIGTVYKPLKKFCSILKLAKPDVKIVVGGHIVADYEFLLNAIPEIDVIVSGEGEITLSKIVNAIESGIDLETIPGIVYRHDGCLVTTKPEKLVTLDELPDIHLDNFNINAYNAKVPDMYLVDEQAKKLMKKGEKHILVFLSRGCPFACFFCYRHIKKYRVYSNEKNELYISYLKKKGYSFFVIKSECLTANKGHLENVCMLAKKYEFYWAIDGRADQITPESLKMLKKHNCVGIRFGIESFDQSILGVMKKKTTPEQNINAINWSFQYGLQTSNILMLIIGSPGEDRKTIFNTRKGMWKCFINEDDVICAILNPYPGSPAYSYGIENGYITDKELLHEAVGHKSKIVVNFSNISKRELYVWQQWIVCEGSLSYRLKHRKILLNRYFFVRWAIFVKAYLLLIKEPLAFGLFNIYLIKGFSYWLKPLKRLKYGELA